MGKEVGEVVNGEFNDVWLKRIQALGMLAANVGVPAVLLAMMIWVGVPIVQQFNTTLTQVSITLQNQTQLLDRISGQLIEHDRKEDAFRDEELLKNAGRPTKP